MTDISAYLDVAAGRAVVTLTDLPVLPVDPEDPWPATPWTLYRTDGLNESPVRAAIERPLTASASAVIVDLEYPRSRQFLYEVRYVDAVDGAVVETSDWIVPPTVELARISDPVTGEGVDLTIVQWPSRGFESRSSVLDVDGRDEPFVIVGKMRAPQSQIVLRTLVAADWRYLQRLLRPGRVLQLRPSKAALDDAYLSVRGYDQARMSNDAEDPRRVHTLEITETAMPAPAVEAAGSTLADLHDAFPEPDTLEDIEAAFTYLYEIAAAPL